VRMMPPLDPKHTLRPEGVLDGPCSVGGMICEIVAVVEPDIRPQSTSGRDRHRSEPSI